MPQSLAIFYKLARQQSLGHRPSNKKNLYNLPRYFAKITDLKKYIFFLNTPQNGQFIRERGWHFIIDP